MDAAGDDVGDDFSILGIGDARLEDTNDRRRAITDAPETNRFADDRRIFLESGVPETVGENHDAVSFGTVVLRADEATEHGAKAHHVEVRTADDATSNGTRL